ncbi:calpain-7-like [Glandiceps talaboti]
MFWDDYTDRYGSEYPSPTMNTDALIQDAIKFATNATRCDQSGDYKVAIFYYTEAIEALYNALSINPDPSLIEKYNEYINRRKELEEQMHIQTNQKPATPVKTKDQIAMERAQFLIKQAFEEDAQGSVKEATELYLQAAEICLETRKSTRDVSLQNKMKKLASQALDRAETLKKPKEESIPSLPTPPSTLPSLDDDDDNDNASGGGTGGGSGGGKPSPKPVNKGHHGHVGNTSIPVSPKPVLPTSVGGSSIGSGGGGGGGGGRGGGGGGSFYTQEEIAVLRRTSYINGKEYVPFISQADLKETFAYKIPFSDSHGKLQLSPKQKEKFAKWIRPDEMLSEPQMIYAVSSFSIKQTVVSDCSFVASLAISAQYERRFQKQLITRVIYPQNKQGQPVYNPCGKYMVKLNLNGVKRKVIIDDTLPVDKYGELLCSFSNNKNELWVSLLEKAYMKVMGGYDFPGSNSNIDLHALTGWIPERVAIRVGSAEFNKDQVFNKMLKKFHQGHVLITMATGMLSDAIADRAGLVSTHAYAMLDIKHIKGKKLFQLKNPWNHLRWKGNYSEKDTEHWTPDLQKALNYDPKTAQQYDNGVFWIDYESLCEFYDVIYMNWNPDLFKYTYVTHHSWSAKEGPKKDNYNIGDNPQYKLEVKGQGAVWALLSRHITEKDDFAENKEYITLLVYKTGGKKVFYPNDPPPYIDGTRINSPHYLCKMLVSDKDSSNYTLVVSQYEKNNSIHYTLRIYGSCDFKLTKVPEPYVSEKELTGHWKGRTAGGCGNYPDTYRNNPIYQVSLQNNGNGNYLMVDLKGPKEYSVGFDVTCVTATGVGTKFTKVHSGDYRRGFTIKQLEDVPGGTYNIMVSTFKQGQEGPFFFTISASCAMTVSQLQ